MARDAAVRMTLAGDPTDLVGAFEKVGGEAKEMAADVDTAAGKMSSDMKGAGTDIAGAVDGSESKFRGLGDTITGTGDIMTGFKEGNIVGVASGFADLAGGMSALVIPAIKSMGAALKTGLAPALTMISAHPLVFALLAAGAIIVGLVLLERKFGVVTKAVNFVKDALTGVWDWVKGNWPLLANILTMPFLGAFRAIAWAWNATVAKLSFKVPSWVPGIGGKGFDVPEIPTMMFHTGGIAGRDQLAMLQQGERVIPRGQNGGSGTTINLTVNALDSQGAAEAVVQALRAYERSNGPVRLALA